MKKLLLFTLMTLISIPAMAEITVEETTDAEYLINSGYSQAAAENIFIQKNRANGNPIEPLYEKSQNKFVKYWNKFYSYLDPAQDSDFRIHHDIKSAPHYSDL